MPPRLPHERVDDTQLQDGEGQCEVEWWFGEGLSYTTFQYSALVVEPNTIEDGQTFRVSPVFLGDTLAKC